MVAGALERVGNVRMDVVDSRTRKDLHAFVAHHVADNADAIFTDAWAAYEGIGDADTRHASVNHSAKRNGSGARSTPTASKGSGACSSVR